MFQRLKKLDQLMHNFLFIFLITFAFGHLSGLTISSLNIKKNQDDHTITNLKTINIHDDFKYNFDSKTINKFYSKKIIEGENKIIVKKNLVIKPKKNINKLSLNVNKNKKILQFAKADWEKEFSDKKSNFIKTLLPLINFENQKIILERNNLKKIKKHLTFAKTLPDSDVKYLTNISKKYKIISNNKHKVDLIDELLVYVNIIPNAIVLAQAANESGWGTSRFAKEYNALFGQYTYDIKNGVVPFEREEGKKHLIRNFSSINKSVESYFININTHYAYEKFRKIRSQLNSNDMKYNIKLLTNTLDVYAEDTSYVKTINSIIDSNNLDQFDIKLQAYINS